MRELELRVKQQSVEVEKGYALRQKATQEKAQLEIHIASISAELQEANRRCVKYGAINEGEMLNVEKRILGHQDVLLIVKYLLEVLRNHSITVLCNWWHCNRSVCINCPVTLITVHRNMILQKEKVQQSEQHEQTVQKLQAKHETDMSHLHQEHALSAAQVHSSSLLFKFSCSFLLISSFFLSSRPLR